MTAPVRIAVVGLGNMGASRACAWHRMEGFEIVVLCARSIASKKLPDEVAGDPRFDNHEKALTELKPDKVFSMKDDPGHRERCGRALACVLPAVRKDLDRTETMEAAADALRLVLCAKRNIAEERAVRLD
jgi:hypothetical protein